MGKRSDAQFKNVAQQKIDNFVPKALKPTFKQVSNCNFKNFPGYMRKEGGVGGRG
jgi:hypothetical protein